MAVTDSCYYVKYDDSDDEEFDPRIDHDLYPSMHRPHDDFVTIDIVRENLSLHITQKNFIVLGMSFKYISVIKARLSHMETSSR
jgi:hypothetical protein